MTALISFLLTLHVAVSGALNFERTSFDFGDHPAQERELDCDFPFTNVSDHPVTISYAVASCSCTKLTWTTDPVPPGGKGVVSARYTKERYKDSFSKQITVVVEGEAQPYFLSFTGSFHETPASLLSDFKYKRGDILFENDPIDLGLVSAGVEVTGRFELANFSQQAVTLDIEDVSPGLILSFDHTSLDPYTRTFAKYYFLPDSLVRGRVELSFTPVANGESLGPVYVRAVQTDNFSALSSAQRNAGALPVLDAREYDFGTIASGQDAEITMMLKNSSETPLHVQSMFANRPGVSFDYPDVVEGGATLPITVTIRSEALRGGNNRFKLSLVSDSPMIPYIETFVRGYVK